MLVSVTPFFSMRRKAMSSAILVGEAPVATPIPVYAITETRLLPAKTQRFIEFLRESLGRA